MKPAPPSNVSVSYSLGEPPSFETPDPPPQPKPEKVKQAYMTKTVWEALQPKGQWDIQVALRGPDSNYGETLKWFTTSVIRGHVRKIMRVGGLVNEDLRLVVLPYGESHSSDPERWNAKHFTEHIHAAASWMNIPIMYIPSEKWHAIMRLRDVNEAGQKILAEAEKAGGFGAGQSIAELQRHLSKGIHHYW